MAKGARDMAVIMALCRSRQAPSVLRSIVFYTKDNQQQPYRKVAGLGKAGLSWGLGPFVCLVSNSSSSSYSRTTTRLCSLRCTTPSPVDRLPHNNNSGEVSATPRKQAETTYPGKDRLTSTMTRPAGQTRSLIVKIVQFHHTRQGHHSIVHHPWG